MRNYVKLFSVIMRRIKMSIAVSINDLKRLGANSIDKQLKLEHEIIVTSHGKNKYAIIEYDELIKIHNDRIELAYLKVNEHIKNGESWTETAEEHIKRLKHELIDE